MSNTEQATLGGGCYWCLEAIYQRLTGVTTVVSGYGGGYVDNPTVEQVYAGTTGHAEVVRVTFDPSVLSYRTILEIFFVMHDPTTHNRQGHDVGEWYRSVIYYHTNEQRQTAEAMIRDFAANLWKDPIVTELTPVTTFWPAEEYMQNYYNKYTGRGYCQMVIDPKIQKLRQLYASKLRPET